MKLNKSELKALRHIVKSTCTAGGLSNGRTTAVSHLSRADIIKLNKSGLIEPCAWNSSEFRATKKGYTAHRRQMSLRFDTQPF